MNIELRRFFEDDSVLDIDYQFTSEDEMFSSPIAVKGRIKSSNSIVSLKADVECSVSVQCAKCAKDIVQKLNVPMEHLLVSHLNDEDNDEFILVDLPGYGYAETSKLEQQRWAKMIDTYLETSQNIACAILVVDIRHIPTKQDVQMLEYLTFNNIPVTIVATKYDKIKKSERNKKLSDIASTLKVVVENIYDNCKFYAFINGGEGVQYADPGALLASKVAEDGAKERICKKCGATL